MPQYIVKLEKNNRESYLVWSTIIDAPVTYGMTRDELYQWCLADHGRKNTDELEKTLRLVEAKGTSSPRDKSARETISFNRAGDNEEDLTYDQIWDMYVDKVKKDGA